MDKFEMEIQIRWSDFDPNYHVRHTSYYDFGTQCRINFLDQEGLKVEQFQREQIGPILFREECVFKREILHGERIFIELWITRAKKDFSRWSIEHPIKKEDGTVAAILSLDGAIFDKKERKLIIPPKNVADVFGKMPKSANFEWT